MGWTKKQSRSKTIRSLEYLDELEKEYVLVASEYREPDDKIIDIVDYGELKNFFE